MSIFSPFSSSVIAWTRDPFTPTHAPTGSSFGSFVITATLALLPGSRATATIFTMPSYTSGTSCSNSFFRKSGCVLDSFRSGPAASLFSPTRKTFTRSPTLKFSRGIVSLRLIIPSVLSKMSRTISEYSIRFTTPEIISPTLPAKSSYCLLRSAARTFWVITCLAD